MAGFTNKIRGKVTDAINTTRSSRDERSVNRLQRLDPGGFNPSLQSVPNQEENYAGPSSNTDVRNDLGSPYLRGENQQARRGDRDQKPQQPYGADPTRAAELDTIREDESLPRKEQMQVPELGDTSRATSTRSYIPSILSNWTSSTPADPPPLAYYPEPRTSQPPPPIPPKNPQVEPFARNSGKRSTDTEKESYLPSSTSKTGKNGSRPAESATGAERELSRIVQQIRKAAEGIVPRSDLDATLDKYGADGALELLLESYRPARVEVEFMREQITAAAQDRVRETTFKAALRDSGTGAGLKLLLDSYQRALAAEKKLNRVEGEIRVALNQMPQKEFDTATKRVGEDALYRVLINDYSSKVSSSRQLKLVEEKVREILYTAPQKERNAGFEPGDILGALKLLSSSYATVISAQDELDRVEIEIESAADKLIPAKDIDAAVKNKGADAALKLLVTYYRNAISGRDTQLKDVRKHSDAVTSRCKTLEADIVRYEAEILALKRKHKTEGQKLDADHKSEIKALQDKAFEKTSNLELRHKEELAKREETHRLEVKRLELALESAKGKHKIEEARLQKALDDQEIEYNKVIVRMSSEHSTEIEEMSADFEVIKKRLQDEHEAKSAGLRNDVEVLTGLVVARQHVKGLSDPDIATQFKTLAGKVDRFSRIPWEKRKESRWPLSDTALRRSVNPKKLKQHLVQSNIWMVLNERIFQSPFAVFGEEGITMHRDWAKNCGEGRNFSYPNWPEATETSETLRHELVKECLEVLKGSGNELNTALDQTVSSSADEIYKAVEVVATVTDGDLQTISEFVRLAATFWLEVTSQKYRVVLSFPNQGASVLGSKSTIPRGLYLVIQPEVRRKGNAQGKRLDKEQVVKDCEGKNEELPSR